MNAKHTPGPWSIGKANFSRDNGVSLDGEVTRLFMPGSVAVLVVGLGASQEEIGADAKLIAAAPDLVELLYEALPYVEEGEEFNKPSCRHLSKKIKELIAKATGESQ